MTHKCEDCQHSFEPRYSGLSIKQVRDQLRLCTSQKVLVVHNGRRHSVGSFYKVNYSWVMWCDDQPMTLSDMHRELAKRSNWQGLHDYSLVVNMRDPAGWAKVFRIEDTCPAITLESDKEAEGWEGEVLIYVHTNEDVLREYNERTS